MPTAREFAPVFLAAASDRSIVVSLTTNKGKFAAGCAPVVGYIVDRTEFGQPKTTRAIVENTQAVVSSDQSHPTTDECSAAGGCDIARAYARADKVVPR